MAAQVQRPLSVEGLVKLARESLSTFAVEVGRKLAECLLTRCRGAVARVTSAVADRSETRQGHQRGYVTLAGQKALLCKPWGLSTGGGGEVELEN